MNILDKLTSMVSTPRGDTANEGQRSNGGSARERPLSNRADRTREHTAKQRNKLPSMSLQCLSVVNLSSFFFNAYFKDSFGT